MTYILLKSLVKIHKAKLSALSNQLTTFRPMVNTVLIVYITIISIQLFLVVLFELNADS